MAFRFLHLADVHLDTPFSGRPDLQQTLRRMLRDAFAAAVTTALRERVDAMLICGDLYDGENLSFATRTLISEQLARLTDGGIAVLYAVGNHDAGMIRDAGLPQGVTVFDDPAPRAVEIMGTRGQPVGLVIGAGYPQPVLREDVARNFPLRDSRTPTVGLLHTQLAEVGPGADYAPTSLRTLLSKNYDYWALGHIHKPLSLDHGQVVYPGCLCGRDWGESGPHGAMLVTAEPGGAVETRFIPLAPVQWVDLTADGLEDVMSLDDLRARLMDRISAALGGEASQTLARIRLTGPCGLYSSLTGPRAQENLASLGQDMTIRLRALDLTVETQGLTPPVDPARWRGQPHMLAEMLGLIDAAATEDAALNAVLAELPAEVGLYGAQGLDEAARRVYTRALLPDLARLICARMTKEDR